MIGLFRGSPGTKVGVVAWWRWRCDNRDEVSHCIMHGQEAGSAAAAGSLFHTTLLSHRMN